MKILIAFCGGMAWVLLTIAGLRYFVPEEPPVDPIVQIMQESWKDTCRLSRYDCSKVDPPSVVFAVMSGAGGRGAYFGSNSVYLDVDQDIREDEARSVLIHEFVHYLQRRVDLMPMSNIGNLQRCVMEGEAFTISNRWLEEQGNTEARVDWARLYACYKEPKDESE